MKATPGYRRSTYGRSRRTLPIRVVELSPATRYAVAAGAAIVSIAARLALDRFWGATLPYLTFFPAVMLSGWLGGFWPGILTTSMTAAAASYLWIGPLNSWFIAERTDWLGLLVFVLVGVVISGLNETWRRGATALVESEEQLDVTLGSIGDAVITTDDRGLVTRLNAVAEALTGWSASQALGRPLQEMFVIISEQTRQPVENPAYRVLRDGLTSGLASNTLLVSRDGREIPIDDSAAPIRAEGGVTTGVVMVFRDVSERRQLERDRESQDRAARELAAIVESSDDAIVSKDLESTVKSWNLGAERMFGYTAAEAVGRSIRIIIPRNRWPEEDDVLSRLRRGEKVDHYETVRQRKDGSQVDVSLTISPIYSAAGAVIGASKIARDISDRKRLDRERSGVLRREKSARAELERAGRLKDDFLAILSHELRTPLNAVLGYAHLLSSGALPAEGAARALQAIRRNAQAQARLVESLLDLSRVIAGKLELNLEELDLLSVIEAALEVLRPEAEAKAITFELARPELPVAVVADGPRLQQVFWNLFSNAIKFTPRHGRVGVGVTLSDGHVRIEVSDNGQGISAEFLPHIFDRFKQEGGRRGTSTPGLGLGLSLVRELVQAHGGTVDAESPGEGCGTTLTVSLPLRAAGTLALQKASAVRPPDVPAPLSHLEILVVDDERDALELLALMLTTRGARARTVSSAAEALEALRQRTPDVLLADIGLPQEDGYSLIRRWRAEERERQLPRVAAIAVTAYARPQDREQAITAGFDWHLAKPVDPDDLIQAVANLTAVESREPELQPRIACSKENS